MGMTLRVTCSKCGRGLDGRLINDQIMVRPCECGVNEAAYARGKRAGFEEGCAHQMEQIEKLRQDEYSRGYIAGRAQGHAEGFTKGEEYVKKSRIKVNAWLLKEDF